MRKYGVILILLFQLLCVIPNVSHALAGAKNDFFYDWWLEFIEHAQKYEKSGTAKSAKEWSGIRAICMSKKGSKDSEYAKNLSFFASREESAKILQKTVDRISIEDQMNVAMFLAQPYSSKAGGSSGTIIDYKSRGELLVKHPLSIPVNMMAWCVAEKAQAMIPTFCIWAVRLFGMLLLIEFIWMAANFVMKFATLGQIIDGFVTKMHLWTFLGSIIITGFYGFSNTNWLYSIFNSFNTIGHESVNIIYQDMQSRATDPSGGPVNPKELSSKRNLDILGAGSPSTINDPIAGEILSPGSFFAMGVLIVSSLWSKVSFSFDIVSIFLIPVLLFVTPIVMMTFSKMVADIVLTMLEGYLAIGVLIILTAFGAARWGADYIQKVLLYCVMMGFKLLTYYLLFAIGVRMMAYVAISTHYISSPGDFIVAIMTMLATTMLLSFLFHRLPQAAGALFGGSPTMSMGQFMGDTLSNIEAGTKTVGAVAGAAGSAGKFIGKQTGATKALAGLKAGIAARTGGATGAAQNAMSSGGGGGGNKMKDGAKDNKKVTSKGLAGVKAAFSGTFDDTPATGNFITPDVSPPPDE